MITPIQTNTNEYDFHLMKARIENTINDANDGSPPPFPKHLMDKLEINQPKHSNKLQPKRRNKRKVKDNNNKSRAEHILTTRRLIRKIKRNIKPIEKGVPISYEAESRRIALCTSPDNRPYLKPQPPINNKSIRIPLITPSPSLRPSVRQHRHTPIFRRSKASRQPIITINNNHRLMLSDSCSEVSYSSDLLFTPSIAGAISTITNNTTKYSDDRLDTIDIGITTFNPFDIYNNDHRKLKRKIDAKPTYNNIPWYHDRIFS